jgi:hypothetical protein
MKLHTTAFLPQILSLDALYLDFKKIKGILREKETIRRISESDSDVK